MRISNIFNNNNAKKTAVEESDKTEKSLNIIVKYLQKLLDNYDMIHFYIKK